MVVVFFKGISEILSLTKFMSRQLCFASLSCYQWINSWAVLGEPKLDEKAATWKTFLFPEPRNFLTTRSAFLEAFRFTSWFKMINFTFCSNYVLETMIVGESFLWVFNLMLNVEYPFPTYCILHNMHSIRQITYSFL